MAIFESFTRILPYSEHAPEGKFIFLLEIPPEGVRMRMIDDRVGYKLHQPSSSRHAVGEFNVFGAGDGERSIVTVHLQKAIAPECGGIRVYKADARGARHQPVAIFILDLHEASRQSLLVSSINAFRSHDVGGFERFEHRIQPVRSWNAVVVSE